MEKVDDRSIHEILNEINKKPRKYIRSRMSENEEYDIFVSYDELTGGDYAKTIHKALTRKGYTVFVAHLQRPRLTGNFENGIDNIIQNCKVFVLVLSYEALTRPQIKREVQFANENGQFSDPQDFWIFHEDLIDVQRGSDEFVNETGVRLESWNQNDFLGTGKLASDALRKCNERRNSKNVKLSSFLPISEYAVEGNFVKSFAASYEKHGYHADFQSSTWKNFYVDLVLRKDNEMILCEFKKTASSVGQNTFRQLLTFKSEIENIEPKTKIKLWLIVKDSLDDKLRDNARDYGIELFDENTLKKDFLLVSTDRTIYPLNSIIHLRIKLESIIKNSPIIIQFLTKNQEIFFETQISIDMEKTFQEFDFPMNKLTWNFDQKYIAKVKHGLYEGSDTFYIKKRHSIIQLDQKNYTWSDQVIITVISPDSDKDNQIAETIGGMDDSKITIKTSRGVLSNYILRETGPSTGIFQGLITLTGFENNFLNQKLPNFGITSGSGPNDGLLSCSNDDVLEIIYENNVETVKATAMIRWNVGEIQWLQPSYSIGDWAVIRVIDPDMNLDPDFPDSFSIHVWSGSDPTGIQVTVKETMNSSGIFQSKIHLNSLKSGPQSLHVSNGDTITAEYVDKTLPDPYIIGNTLAISSSAVIGDDVLFPIDKIEIKNPRILDENNHQIFSVLKGQKIQITCDLKNRSNYDEMFAYIASVKDDKGITIVTPLWLSGTILKKQSFTASLPWIPDSSGVCYVDIYVWKSIDSLSSLSPPISFKFKIS